MPPPEDALSKIIAPGVYIEEVSDRSRSIEGQPTSTAGFIGAAAEGPVGKASELITSYRSFQQVFQQACGDVPEITFGGATETKTRNYLALAVRAFFDNGGKRLYISRVAALDGTNSAAPAADDYIRALAALEAIEEIAIVAAPGGSVAGAQDLDAVAPVHDALIAHANRTAAYRFAVLDPPPGCSTAGIQAVRSRIDAKNAALYYPWVTITDPYTTANPPQALNVPPSGFLCGIYARTDTERGVFKAPANEPLLGARGFERSIGTAEAEVLNPFGINCLRSFTGRGNLVWGARTTSSDPEWKYVNVRRYLLYLEHSIDRGLQWAVFEPNGEQLWTTVRQTVSNFLTNEWRSGALLGTKPDDAFFVKCDRTTMTQNDLDNGLMICLIGVALIKPAEFVIFRIGQKTAEG